MNAWPLERLSQKRLREPFQKESGCASGCVPGSILDQPIVFAFIRNSFRGLARPIPRPGAFYNLIELDRGGDSDSADFFPLGN